MESTEVRIYIFDFVVKNPEKNGYDRRHAIASAKSSDAAWARIESAYANRGEVFWTRHIECNIDKLKDDYYIF